MRKVLIIGVGGAGKTTLAKAIAERTGLPLVHLDQLYWRPGWVPTPNDAWDVVVSDLIARDAWVMDGNYGRTLGVRLAAADTIVFLDLPRRIAVWRVLKRRFRYLGRTRPELPTGCRERLSLEFLQWIWTYRRRRRPEILQRLKDVAADKRVVVLRNPRAVREFIDSLGGTRALAGFRRAGNGNR